MLLLALVLLALPGHARAEAGESFTAANPPSVQPMPAMVTDDGPSIGVIRVPRDPPQVEAARGAVRRDALATRPVKRVAKPAAVEAAAHPSKPSASSSPPVQEGVETPGSVLIHRAEAAELGGSAAPSEMSWRRVLGSRYTAWVALVLLIGVPLFGLIQRQRADRREERDLKSYN